MSLSCVHCVRSGALTAGRPDEWLENPIQWDLLVPAFVLHCLNSSLFDYATKLITGAFSLDIQTMARLFTREIEQIGLLQGLVSSIGLALQGQSAEIIAGLDCVNALSQTKET